MSHVAIPGGFRPTYPTTSPVTSSTKAHRSLSDAFRSVGTRGSSSRLMNGRKLPTSSTAAGSDLYPDPRTSLSSGMTPRQALKDQLRAKVAKVIKRIIYIIATFFIRLFSIQLPSRTHPLDKAREDEATADEARTREARTPEARAGEAPTDRTRAGEARTREARAGEAPPDEAPADEAPADRALADEAPAREARAGEARAGEAREDEVRAQPELSERPGPHTRCMILPLRRHSRGGSLSPHQLPPLPENVFHFTDVSAQRVSKRDDSQRGEVLAQRRALGLPLTPFNLLVSRLYQRPRVAPRIVSEETTALYKQLLTTERRVEWLALTRAIGQRDPSNPSIKEVLFSFRSQKQKELTAQKIKRLAARALPTPSESKIYARLRYLERELNYRLIALQGRLDSPVGLAKLQQLIVAQLNINSLYSLYLLAASNISIRDRRFFDWQHLIEAEHRELEQKWENLVRKLTHRRGDLWRESAPSSTRSDGITAQQAIPDFRRVDQGVLIMLYEHAVYMVMMSLRALHRIDDGFTGSDSRQRGTVRPEQKLFERLCKVVSMNSLCYQRDGDDACHARGTTRHEDREYFLVQPVLSPELEAISRGEPSTYATVQQRYLHEAITHYNQALDDNRLSAQGNLFHHIYLAEVLARQFGYARDDGFSWRATGAPASLDRAFDLLPDTTLVTLPTTEGPALYYITHQYNREGISYAFLAPLSASEDAKLHLVFRGTKDTASVARDLSTGIGHRSLREHIPQLLKKTSELLDQHSLKNLLVCGHSLGGLDTQRYAAAFIEERTKATCDIPTEEAYRTFSRITHLEVYTFAAPKVTAQEFNHFQRVPLRDLNCSICHVLDKQDLVPQAGEEHLCSSSMHTVFVSIKTMRDLAGAHSHPIFTWERAAPSRERAFTVTPECQEILWATSSPKYGISFDTRCTRAITTADDRLLNIFSAMERAYNATTWRKEGKSHGRTRSDSLAERVYNIHLTRLLKQFQAVDETVVETDASTAPRAYLKAMSHDERLRFQERYRAMFESFTQHRDILELQNKLSFDPTNIDVTIDNLSRDAGSSLFRRAE